MPVSKVQEAGSAVENRDFAILDLLTALERSLAAADGLGLSSVGIRLDQAILALLRERSVGAEARGPTRARASRH